MAWENCEGFAAAADFLIVPGTLNFAPGETSRAFNVQITRDRVVEPGQTLTLALANPVGAGLSMAQARLTIAEPGIFISGFE